MECRAAWLLRVSSCQAPCTFPLNSVRTLAALMLVSTPGSKVAPACITLCIGTAGTYRRFLWTCVSQNIHGKPPHYDEPGLAALFALERHAA